MFTKTKYTKILSGPVKEEMFDIIHQLAQDKDIPVSMLIREALRRYIEEESKNG
jgi:predicted transcriptional regulator